MPEGDSVLQQAQKLQWMVGRTTTAELRVRDGMKIHGTVQRVWPYGKNLFMHIGDRILHTHLRMEGKWVIGKPNYKTRVLLRFDDVLLLGQELGFVRVFAPEEYPQVLERYGPDILGEWDPQEATRRILQQPDRPLGEALLDQWNVAGIGNEYRNEVMFLRGYHPLLTVAQADVPRTLDLTRRVMWQNRWEPRRVFTGNRRQPNYVFSRAGKPCRRCEQRIQKMELDRIVTWCPRCQPEILRSE